MKTKKLKLDDNTRRLVVEIVSEALIKATEKLIDAFKKKDDLANTKSFSLLLWIVCLLARYDLEKANLTSLSTIPGDGFSFYISLTPDERKKVEEWFRKHGMDMLLEQGLQLMSMDVNDPSLFSKRWEFLKLS